MKLTAALLLISVVFVGGEKIKTLIFSAETDTSYVEMVPQKPLSLDAFTLCMHVATELTGEREVVLFSYRTKDTDELNVWRELDGSLALYLAGEAVKFNVPQLGALETQLCVTWESSSGAAAFFVDGKKSLIKIHKKGHTISPGGTVIVGQDQDSVLGAFDIKQSFVGEISEINLWDSVLSDRTIHDMFDGKRVPRANVFDWESTELKVTGQVQVVQHEL